MAGNTDRRLVDLVALGGILLLAAYLRLANVTDNPGWYTDEGTHLELAQNLAAGKIQYFAVGESLMITARQPLFELLLAAAVTVFGAGMGTLRALTALLGVLSAGLVYGFLRHTQQDRVLPLLAALITATHPLTILYNRLGYSYALLTPLILIMAWALTVYAQTGARRALLVAAGAVGLGITSDLMMGAVVPVLVLVVGVKRPHDLVWSLPVVAFPFAVYVGVMLIAAPDAFLFDLRHTLLRLNANPLHKQLSLIAHNYTILLSQDFWMPLGMAGLFLMRPARLRWVCLATLLLPVLFLGRTVPLYSLSLYYITPLLPFITIGVGAFIREGAPYLRETAQRGLRDLWRESTLTRLLAVGFAVMVFLIPLGTALKMTLDNIQGRYPTAIDSFLLDPEHVRRAAAYVNARAQAPDLVVASPGVGWTIDAHVADYQMAVVLLGQATVDLPQDLPQDRFAFNPTYLNAKFAIVDNLWRNWAAFHMPPVAQMLDDITTHWPLIWQMGALEVYANPVLGGAP